MPDNLDRLEALEKAATPAPWEAEHRPNNDPPQCGANVTNADGHNLFDSFNRDHRVSLIERLSDDGGWYDVAGMKDLELAAAARNALPVLLAVARAAKVLTERMDELDVY